MKKCSACKEEKELEEFSKNSRRKDGLQTDCKSCSRAKSKVYYKENKAKLKKQTRAARDKRVAENQHKLCLFLKEHPCIDCGEDDIVVLEFDHQRDKEAHIPDLLNAGYSWERILREIQKCEVRCSNCHTRKTARDFNWYSYQFSLRE